MKEITNIKHDGNFIEITISDKDKNKIGNVLRIDRGHAEQWTRLDWIRSEEMRGFCINDSLELLNEIENGESNFFSRMRYGDFEIAAEYFNCEHVETTPNANGYPSQIKSALIGFDSFQRASEVAAFLGLEIVYLDKKDGWIVWHRNRGNADCEYEITPADFGDGYWFFGPDSLKGYKEDILEAVTQCEKYEDVVRYIDDAKIVCEKIQELSDDEVVVVLGDTYYDTIKPHCMRYEFDGHYHEIGLINPNN